MEHLWTAFTVIFPLMVMMATGYGLKRLAGISESVFLIINRIIFYVAIPSQVFRSIAFSDIGMEKQGFFCLWIVGWILIVFVLCQLLIPRWMPDPKRSGVAVQATVRSNDAIFGMAVATALFGTERLGTMALAIALSVPMFNVLGVVALEINCGGKVHVGHLLRNIAKNPIILAVLLGFLVRLINIPIPDVLLSPVHSFAELCTPLGFLVLGGMLTVSSLKENRKPLFWISLVKLILMPLVIVSLSALVGFRGEQLLSLLILFGAPTAMAGFPLACAMGADGKLAGELVAVTTALSLPTMFLLLTAFGGLL